MKKRIRLIFALVACLLIGGLVNSSVMAMEGPADRKERILANLKLTFPQLEQMVVTMGDIEPSGYGSLDEGMFIIGGRQKQRFLVSRDDKKLFLVSGEPIDVSLSKDEVAAEITKRTATAAQKAAAIREELASNISNQPYRGASDAPVTIVEFSDFQCPYCSEGFKTVEQIIEKYPNDVKFVFKHFPLSSHPWAKKAAIAAYCGALQKDEAFWTLHDNYFNHQKEINPGNVIAKSKEYLSGSDIDMAAWSTCAEDINSDKYKNASTAVDADLALGKKLGVSGTPGFFVNGLYLNGALPIAAFEPLINAAKTKNESAKF
ncbi:thioredoxin domain-containing protein [Malonomonas rubra]|uniref:DsbA family protein n=1 Tax=Malonomonas rubra TaxID=57040 RepID=UPI0026EAB35E|nr:thioredoxin domain-containing protein [Malonomonas rubra]